MLRLCEISWVCYFARSHSIQHYEASVVEQLPFFRVTWTGKGHAAVGPREVEPRGTVEY